MFLIMGLFILYFVFSITFQLYSFFIYVICSDFTYIFSPFISLNLLIYEIARQLGHLLSLAKDNLKWKNKMRK